jgi:hypothetical protein
MVISIETAVYFRNDKIQFSFSDGVEKILDFPGFLKNAKNQ